MEPIRSIILVDAPEGGGTFEADALERMGHEVVICHGPAARQLCPILRTGGSCDKVEGVHGVVFELDLDRAQHRAILNRYREILADGVPIRVVVDPDQAAAYQHLLADVEVWDDVPSVGDLDGFSSRVEGYERVTTEI